MSITTEGLTKVSRNKLHQQIAAQIQELISQGKLKDGDQLPPERELASVFEVSRHSVREAIRTLEEKGVLQSRVGSGTYVIARDKPSVADFLAWALEKEEDQLAETFQLRQMIEPKIAALAARNSNPALLQRLDRLMEQQRAATGDYTRLANLDELFHLALAEASGNGILFEVVRRINKLTGGTRKGLAAFKPRRRQTIEGHTQIIEAIRQKDSHMAELAMRKHIREVQEVIL